MIEITENHNIGALVTQNYRTASVFKKFKIDFCCQGNRSIADACSKDPILLKNILAELNRLILDQEEDFEPGYDSWPLELLIDYIVKKHHSYVRAKSSEINGYLTKISKIHGQSHPELETIKELFSTATEDLQEHMVDEELNLFPYIKHLSADASKLQRDSTEHYLANLVQNITAEHQEEGERFRKISELSNTYTAPPDACSTYRVSFSLLKEFEERLHLHIHLENNILFPRALNLEKKLTHAYQAS